MGVATGAPNMLQSQMPVVRNEEQSWGDSWISMLQCLALECYLEDCSMSLDQQQRTLVFCPEVECT